MKRGLLVAITVLVAAIFLAIGCPPVPPPPPECLNPADGATDVPVDVTFSWTSVSGATEYEFILAFDEALTNILIQEITTTPSYGPVILDYDTDYWYAVRATAPTTSPQCICFFHTITAPTPPPECLNPADGATDVPVDVTFSWTSVSGATEYEFILAFDEALTNILIQEITTTPSYGPVILDYDTDYWYAVRATAPTTSPQCICFFHTITAPTP